jgi:hypothetical protein
MNNKTCPICGNQFINVLEHIAIVHEVTDIEVLKKLTDNYEKRETNRSEFSKYIDELNSKLKEGKITSEQYRELSSRWRKEHY